MKAEECRYRHSVQYQMANIARRVMKAGKRCINVLATVSGPSLQGLRSERGRCRMSTVKGLVAFVYCNSESSETHSTSLSLQMREVHLKAVGSAEHVLKPVSRLIVDQGDLMGA